MNKFIQLTHGHHRDEQPGGRDLFVGGMSFAAAELASAAAPVSGWFYLLDRERGEEENVPAVDMLAEFVR